MRRVALGLQNVCARLQVTATCNTMACTVNARQFHATGCIKLPNAQAEWTTKEMHFVNTAQQVRKYAPTTGNALSCWNCKKLSQRKNYMLCEDCGYLQDVNKEINYFDLLDFPKCFDIEKQQLTQSFRRLQTLVHPDKFSNKSMREQNNSADWSSLINKAYKTLQTPIERGQYLLKMQGEQIPQDNSALNKEFLMDMMERNEHVEAANNMETLEVLVKQVDNELQSQVEKLEKCFNANNLDDAKSVLVEMKYLLSIQNSIKKKMQTLMVG